MSRFPSVDRIVKKKVHETVHFDIYCVCRQPQGFQQVVCCDECNHWFHSDCVIEDVVDSEVHVYMCTLYKLNCMKVINLLAKCMDTCTYNLLYIIPIPFIV